MALGKRMGSGWIALGVHFNYDVEGLHRA